MQLVNVYDSYTYEYRGVALLPDDFAVGNTYIMLHRLREVRSIERYADRVVVSAYTVEDGYYDEWNADAAEQLASGEFDDDDA